MRIDAQTGHVEVLELGLTITPDFKRRQFLSSLVGKQATISVHNGHWCSWKFGPVAVDAIWVYFIIYFHEEQVQMLSLGLHRSEWQDDDQGPELELREAQRLLTGVWQAPPGAYSWGAIEASIDPRTGYAGTSIAYKALQQRLS